MTANQRGSHSQLRALSVRWCRNAQGAWWYLCALVPLPARASAAAVHKEVARSFSMFLPQDKESFGLPKIDFLDLGQIFKKTRLNSSSGQTFPEQWLPCCLADPRAHSAVECLQPESLTAVFSPCLRASSAPKEGDILSQVIFSRQTYKRHIWFFF